MPRLHSKAREPCLSSIALRLLWDQQQPRTEAPGSSSRTEGTEAGGARGGPRPAEGTAYVVSPWGQGGLRTEKRGGLSPGSPAPKKVPTIPTSSCAPSWDPSDSQDPLPPQGVLSGSAARQG